MSSCRQLPALSEADERLLFEALKSAVKAHNEASQAIACSMNDQDKERAFELAGEKVQCALREFHKAFGAQQNPD